MKLIIFIYGIVLGSFLNVCILRIPREESIITIQSHCFSCNHRLNWKDLIPVFSYIFLKGKCRYCGSKVSIRYPLIELLTGILLTVTYIRYGLSFIFIKYSVLILFLITIAMIDYDTTDVYSSVIYIGIFIGIIFLMGEKIIYSQSLLNYVLGASIGLIVIGGICVLTGGMGEGDIEVAVLCGVYLGWKMEVYFILLSFIFGGTIAAILIFTKKKKKTDYIPLGPSLALGAYVVILLGDNVVLKLIGLS